MTDGTTAIQVSPITEDDMSRVQSILKRAADAIVGISQLSTDVEALRQTVASLQADCDRLRNQNNALDEALAHSRNVRDQQATELSETKYKLIQIEKERDDLKSTCLDDAETIKQLNEKLTQAITDRDDNGFKVMELEDKLKTAEDKLSAIAAHFPTPIPTPEPTPAPVAPVEPTMQPTPEPVMYPPAQAPDPTPAPTEQPTPPKNTWDRYLPDGTYNPDYLPF